MSQSRGLGEAGNWSDSLWPRLLVSSPLPSPGVQLIVAILSSPGKRASRVPWPPFFSRIGWEGWPGPSPAGGHIGRAVWPLGTPSLSLCLMGGTDSSVSPRPPPPDLLDKPKIPWP